MDVAIHLVGADLVVALQLELARRLQQHVGAVDVGLDEGVRVHDRAVDVRLGREVDDRVDLVRLQRLSHRLCVADVALHEGVARIVVDVQQVVQVAGVGQLVVDQDAIVGVLVQHVADEVRPDEPGAAGDHQVLHSCKLPCN